MLLLMLLLIPTFPHRSWSSSCLPSSSLRLDDDDARQDAFLLIDSRRVFVRRASRQGAKKKRFAPERTTCNLLGYLGCAAAIWK